MGVDVRLAWIAACSLLFVGCGGSGGVSSGPVQAITNPIPTLTAITPASTLAGSASLTLTATGSGFVTASELQWNGSVLTTTFDSSAQIHATVPASDLGTAGIQDVVVVNPSPGGGKSAALSFTINSAPNPLPTITGLSPARGSAGGSAFTLTVTGSGFVSGSQILWNGTARATAFLSSTSVSALISSSDVVTPGTATVTVSNPAPGGGSSNVLNFSVATTTSTLTVVDIEGNDLAWAPQQQRFYVSVPATATTMGNTITVVDPIAGAILSSIPVTSEPGRLSITDDAQFLYAILATENSVARYKLPAVSADIKWDVGSDPIFGTIYTPFDLKAQPAVPHTVAVARAPTSPFPGFANGLVVYDDAHPRANFVQNAGAPLSSVEWKTDGSALFVEDNLSSNRGLYTFAVNSTGVTANQQFGAAFRTWGVHLHSDPQTGYLYSDQGEIVNSSSGLPIGNYPITRQAGAQTLTAIDPALNRAFVLTPTTDSSNQPAFLIRAFDQIKLNLLRSFLIPGAAGIPANFIRWGTSGLAFVTKQAGPGSPQGKMYILDGEFVNSSGPLDSVGGTALNPLPTLLKVDPVSTTAGSGSVTITLTGRDFANDPTVLWNGAAIATVWVSDTELQATVPSSDLAAVGQANLAVVNAGPGGGASSSLLFSINPASPPGNRIDVYGVGGNDLVWDSQRHTLYVSVPGIQGDLGDKIAIVDPVARTLNASAFIGSDPARLTLSSDMQYLYVGMNGQNLVQRLLLPGLSSDISFPLGSDSFDGPFLALGLKAAPGSPHAVAVGTAIFDGSPSSTGITIFDDTAPRPVRAPGWNTSANAYASIEWGADNTTMYSADQSFPTALYVLSVNANGIQIGKNFPDALHFPSSDFAVHFDNGTGLLYTDGGEVVRPSDAAIIGAFGAFGLVAPDSSLNRVFILGQTTAQVGTSNFTISSFNETSFAAIDSMTVNNVVGTPTTFVRWGANGLAFVTRVGAITDTFNVGPGELYVISGTFVNPAVPAN